MNLLWLIMIAVSLMYAFFTGNISVINDVCLKVGKDTFDFVLPLICMTCFWNGVLYVAKEAKTVEKIANGMKPVISNE